MQYAGAEVDMEPTLLYYTRDGDEKSVQIPRRLRAGVTTDDGRYVFELLDAKVDPGRAPLVLEALAEDDPDRAMDKLAQAGPGEYTLAVRHYTDDGHTKTVLVQADRWPIEDGRMHSWLKVKGSLYEYNEQDMQQQLDDLPDKAPFWNFLRIFGGALVKERNVEIEPQR